MMYRKQNNRHQKIWFTPIQLAFVNYKCKQHWRMIFCSSQADNMTLVFCYCGTQIFGNTMLFVQWQTPIFWPLCVVRIFIKPCNIYNSGSSMQVWCLLIGTFVFYKFKITGTQSSHQIEILHTFSSIQLPQLHIQCMHSLF